MLNAFTKLQKVNVSISTLGDDVKIDTITIEYMYNALKCLLLTF